MTKQNNALRLADEVDEVAQTFPDMAEVSAMIRTQHAAIERKDALLRQALVAITHGCPPGCNDGMTDSGGTYPWGEAVLIPCPTCETVKAITKELEQ